MSPVNWSGAVLLKPPETRESYERKRWTKLIRVGRKLAVLGVEDGPKAMSAWHICRPGTWNMPQGLSGTECQGDDLAYAKALCGRTVVTNGYCSDFRPPDGLLCKACAEQL